jgi:mono/diheme cytochrome c family protein
MNYPVWQLGFPGGILIAIVAVVHVFVSHFAVGGGAYLVMTEGRAYRTADENLLAYVRRHSKFFALLTVVFGAVTGVGIWFTIGLISPEGTSSLIHTFVWGWAIEWVFFFVEIAAAIIYAYNWDRLDRQTHLVIGWIYFIAAYMSLVVINGIITYMLTPGRWLETKNFWDGFFNPTYLPSALIRTAMAIALAGMYGLITAVRDKSSSREKIVRWAGYWMLVGAALLPPLAIWYFGKFPQFSHAYVAGLIPSLSHVERTIFGGTALILLLTLIFALLKPRWMNVGVVFIIMVTGFMVMGSGEYMREFSRKPWVVNGYIYANDLRVADVERVSQQGVSKTSPWLPDAANSPAYGKELFAVQCGSCHSVAGYRSMSKRVRGWDDKFATEMLLHLELIRGTMPPFAGTERDRAALGQYLASIAQPKPAAANDAELGRQQFEMRCAMCHTLNGARRPLDFTGMDFDTVNGFVGQLSDLSPNMPPFTGSDAERKALVNYLLSAGNKPPSQASVRTQ